MNTLPKYTNHLLPLCSTFAGAELSAPFSGAVGLQDPIMAYLASTAEIVQFVEEDPVQ